MEYPLSDELKKMSRILHKSVKFQIILDASLHLIKRLSPSVGLSASNAFVKDIVFNIFFSAFFFYGTLYYLDISCCPRRFLQLLLPPPVPLMTATTDWISNAVAATRDIIFHPIKSLTTICKLDF